MSSSISRRVSDERWRLGAIWASLLTGPICWLVLLEVSYLLAGVACETRSTWFMHLAVVAALVIVGSAGYAGWAAAVRDRHPAGDTDSPPLSQETRLERSRWMSLAGVALSGWFMLVILAMEVPILVLRECQ